MDSVTTKGSPRNARALASKPWPTRLPPRAYNRTPPAKIAGAWIASTDSVASDSIDPICNLGPCSVTDA